MSDMPRRSDMSKWVVAEHAIATAMRVVEDMPADVRLTDAIVLLGAALKSVADYVDGIDTRRTVCDPTEITRLTTETCDLTARLDLAQQATGIAEAERDALRALLARNIDPLAAVLLAEFGGPTCSESACEMAVRLLRELAAERDRLRAALAEIAPPPPTYIYIGPAEPAAKETR